MKKQIVMTLIAGALMANPSMYGKVTTSPDTVLNTLPAYNGEGLELCATENSTDFRLWSPEAEAAEVIIYPTDRNTAATDTIAMSRGEQGTWTANIARGMYGKFYTFRIKYKGEWL